MASAGRVLIIPKGEWNVNENYEMLDLVYCDGASWIAKSDSQGIRPTGFETDYWQKIADVGAKVGFIQKEVVCNNIDAQGNIYSIDLSEYRNLIGAIHYLGTPSEMLFGSAMLYQNSNTEGVIRTDTTNTFKVNCVVFYM